MNDSLTALKNKHLNDPSSSWMYKLSIAIVKQESLKLVIYNRGFLIEKAVAQMCSVKKVLLEISQNSHENTCARVFFLIKLQGWLLVAASFCCRYVFWKEIIKNPQFFLNSVPC